jgi:hypothetical protein
MSDRKLDEKISDLFNEHGINDDQLVQELLIFITHEERQSRTFLCPKCETNLVFNLEVNVKRVRTLEDSQKEKGEVPLLAKPRFSPEEEVLLAELKANGLYQAFVEAMERLLIQGKPNHMGRYLLNWIEAATRVKIPTFTQRILINEFKSGLIQVYAAQYMAAIVVSGKVKAFYPYHLLKGERVEKLTPTGGQLTSTSKPMTTEVWRRSRFGYVVGDGAFFSEMQKHSKGAFASSQTNEK